MKTTTNSPEAQDGVRCAKCGTVRLMSSLASRDTFVCRKCLSTEAEPEAQPQGVELLPCPFQLPVHVQHNTPYFEIWAGTSRLAKFNEASGSAREIAEYIASALNTRTDLPRATADNVTASALVQELWRNGLLNDPSDSQAERAASIVADFLRAPRATGETTVEAALAELREMFPEATFISVKVHAIYQPSFPHQPQADIQIEDRGFRRTSLADCMAQVRAAAQTKGESGEK